MKFNIFTTNGSRLPTSSKLLYTTDESDYICFLGGLTPEDRYTYSYPYAINKLTKEVHEIKNKATGGYYIARNLNVCCGRIILGIADVVDNQCCEFIIIMDADLNEIQRIQTYGLDLMRVYNNTIYALSAGICINFKQDEIIVSEFKKRFTPFAMVNLNPKVECRRGAMFLDITTCRPGGDCRILFDDDYYRVIGSEGTVFYLQNDNEKGTIKKFDMDNLHSVDGIIFPDTVISNRCACENEYIVVY